MQKFIVKKPQKLKDFTDENYAQGSFAFSRLLRDRDVRVNGEKVSENVMLSTGDEVTYYTSEREERKIFYREVYRDENVLVVDKYPGVNSEAIFSALEKQNMRPVHRLDRNTAGIMILACNEEAEKELLFAFRSRKVEKIYEAICFHSFIKKEDALRAYWKKDDQAARVFISEKPCSGAEEIRTDYKVLQEFGEYSLVKICLHSGKTHQIRAHMAFIGHPIAGDQKYGDERLNKKYHIKRQILVAKQLSIHSDGILRGLDGKVFESAFEAKMP